MTTVTFDSISYLLPLSDTLSFNLVSYADTNPWLINFANFLELEKIKENKQNQADTIMAVPLSAGTLLIDQLKREYFAEYALNHWQNFDLKFAKIYIHPQTAGFIFALDPQREYVSRITMMQLFLDLIFLRIYEKNVFSLHGGLVVLKQEGVLLLGPGGIGKSTCCERIPAPWKALSDDLTLAALSSENSYVAYPLPTWSRIIAGEDSVTCDFKEPFKIRGICFLTQGKEDSINSLHPSQAAVLIYKNAKSIYIPLIGRFPFFKQKTFTAKTLDYACALAKEVPCYKLEVSLEGKFWEKIEEVIDTD